LKILEKLISIEDYKNDIRIKATKMLEKLKSGDKVCRLQKSLYGLKQSSREWNTRIDEELRRFGATASKADSCIYYKGKGKLFS